MREHQTDPAPSEVRVLLGAGERELLFIGAGLAGLVAAAELVDARRRVIILDQEPEASYLHGGIVMQLTSTALRVRILVAPIAR